LPGDDAGTVDLTHRYDGSLLLEQKATGAVEGTVGFEYDQNFWLDKLKVQSAVSATDSATIDFDYDTMAC
jgi:hypothetical protein